MESLAPRPERRRCSSRHHAQPWGSDRDRQLGFQRREPDGSRLCPGSGMPQSRDPPARGPPGLHPDVTEQLPLRWAQGSAQRQGGPIMPTSAVAPWDCPWVMGEHQGTADPVLSPPLQGWRGGTKGGGLGPPPPKSQSECTAAAATASALRPGCSWAQSCAWSPSQSSSP